MTFKQIMGSLTFAALAMAALNVNAGNINANAARTVASNFIHQQAAKGSFRSHVALNDIKLVHAEASSAVKDANDYYAFNLTGGGFIIIAGEDRAAQVLGYSDRGQFDFNHMPYGLQGLLSSFKEEIEFLQTYKGDDLVPAPQSFNASNGVEPLIKTNWGQEDPYDWQCPVYQGLYCAVGCVATAMAQVMKYWQYPEGSGSLDGYYCYAIRQNVPALPATTFDYSLMLNSYCHWDYDLQELIQDTYTEAQGNEVAKISRYCGQAVEMNYHPDGSGAYTQDQRNAMVSFGYRSSAKYVQKGSGGGWWGQGNYTTEQWETLMKTELDAGRPILYAASDTGGGAGHAFICDGYNSDGKFHYNFGWYGTCDGWYVSTALNMVHRSGDECHFNSGHEMVTGVQPPEGWQPPVTLQLGDVNGDSEVNIADVTALIDYLLGNNASTNIHLEVADINGDNDINIADVTKLIDQLLN